METKFNDGFREEVREFIYLNSSISYEGGLKEDAIMNVSEGMKLFEAIKIMWNVRRIDIDVKNDL